MSNITAETIELMEMLPEADQRMLRDLARKFVLAWNPEDLGLTPNDETISALEEGEEMIRHPERYKSYATFREFMEDVENEA